MAIEWGNSAVAALLMARGAEIPLLEGYYLQFALWRGPVDSVRLLLDRGADVNMRDFQGRTPLLLALEALDMYKGGSQIKPTVANIENNIAVIRLLLERGGAARTAEGDLDVMRLVAKHSSSQVRQSFGINECHERSKGRAAGTQLCTLLMHNSSGDGLALIFPGWCVANV